MTGTALGIQIACDRFLIKGVDRAKWLHNFCTADINRLEIGDSAEALVLNGKGKTIGWMHVFSRTEGLQILTPTGSAARLMEHFERYVIREDVSFEISNDPPIDFFLWGPQAVEKFREQTGVPLTRNQSVRTVFNGQEVWATQITMIGRGVLVEVAPQSLSDPEAWFSSTGFEEGTGEELAWHRIRHRCPKWRTDFSDESLPQELVRDDLCISFTKGCYLGQETVARIDALGHVNRVLAVVSIESAADLVLPEDVFQGENKVGQLTSVVPDLENEDRHLGLATLKRSVATSGTSLQIGGAMTSVVEPLAANR
jgi:tRNA-modifying protein YgfZ